LISAVCMESINYRPERPLCSHNHGSSNDCNTNQQYCYYRIDKVVAMIDADGDGWVTWEEFRDHLSNRRMSAAFSTMDLDGDGQISSDEFRKFYIGADLDGDGQISETEMRDFLKKTSATD